MKLRQVEGVWQYANEIVFERDNQPEDADEAPITGTDNVTDDQPFDNNLQHIMNAIQGLQLSMTDHHKKVEKMMEELVNRVHVIEDRLPPPTSG
ncbi:desmin [Sesbania bispinosa]|nr:desmin [Sesbania bispinosa]